MEFLKLTKEETAKFNIDRKLLQRDLNDGFSGGEKKRNELIQLLMLQPDLIMLDEIDSGLDVDAIRIVSKGINLYKNDKLIHELELPVAVSLFDTSIDPVIDNGVMIIEPSKLSFNMELFTYSADNREMSKSLKEVQKLIERKNKEGIEDAHQLTKALITALNESGIVLSSVYLEIIIFNLMKNRGKDFVNEKHLLNEIMGMSEALQTSATSISLSFERLKDQLKNTGFYNNTRESVYDIFYQ
jgi:ABC-type multidrug transport system ATPase subunit